MNILIKSIPQKEQRYPTVGDWYDKDGQTVINVSEELGNDDYIFMIAVHELIEQYLCKKRGITQEMVDKFDNDHLDAEDPGYLPDAPYHNEHMFAMTVEGMLANQLDIDFTYDGKYNNKLGEVCPCIPKPTEDSSLQTTEKVPEEKIENIPESVIEKSPEETFIVEKAT